MSELSPCSSRDQGGLGTVGETSRSPPGQERKWTVLKYYSPLPSRDIWARGNSCLRLIIIDIGLFSITHYCCRFKYHCKLRIWGRALVVKVVVEGDLSSLTHSLTHSTRYIHAYMSIYIKIGRWIHSWMCVRNRVDGYRRGCVCVYIYT